MSVMSLAALLSDREVKHNTSILDFFVLPKSEDWQV